MSHVTIYALFCYNKLQSLALLIEIIAIRLTLYRLYLVVKLFSLLPGNTNNVPLWTVLVFAIHIEAVAGTLTWKTTTIVCCVRTQQWRPVVSESLYLVISCASDRYLVSLLIQQQSVNRVYLTLQLVNLYSELIMTLLVSLVYTCCEYGMYVRVATIVFCSTIPLFVCLFVLIQFRVSFVVQSNND